MSDQESNPTPAASSDSNTIALLTWIGTFFFWFVPSLIVYLVKKDDPYVNAHAKEALNWSITVGIAYVASTILMMVLIGFLMAAAVWVIHLVFCILGAINASKGVAYQLPFNLRLIK